MYLFYIDWKWISVIVSNTIVDYVDKILLII